MMTMFEEVEVEAYVYPTEDIRKVKKAMLNLIPGLQFEAFDKGEYVILVGRTKDKRALQRCMSSSEDSKFSTLQE